MNVARDAMCLELAERATRSTPAFLAAHAPCVAHPTRGLVPFTPFPYQRDILRSLDRGGPHVVLKARQTGLSTTVMMQKLRRCLQPGTMTLVVSRKEDTAKELLRIARQGAATCDPPFPVPIAGDNVMELRFVNGSRIRAESASPETGRTFAASDLVFDEFAFLPWQEEMWRSVRPTVSRGGNVCIVSTPDMEGDLFHRRWEHALHAEEWHPFRVHWQECPDYDDRWYAENRPDYTEAEWAQEYECEFGRASDAVFKGPLVNAAQDLADATPYERAEGAQFVIGADMAGQGRDCSVYVALDVSVSPIRVVEVAEWETLPAPGLQVELEQMIDRYAGATAWCDRTGLGWGIIGNMRRNTVGVAFTGGQAVSGSVKEPNIPRTMLVNNLVIGLEQGALAIPRREQALLMGLRAYRWAKRTVARGADHVDALALAWWAATRASRAGVFSQLL